MFSKYLKKLLSKSDFGKYSSRNCAYSAIRTPIYSCSKLSTRNLIRTKILTHLMFPVWGHLLGTSWISKLSMSTGTYIILFKHSSLLRRLFCVIKIASLWLFVFNFRLKPNYFKKQFFHHFFYLR